MQQMQQIEQDFARRFAEAFKRPSPERLIQLLHPDVVQYQPHTPPIRGREAAFREFDRLFRWLPDIRGEVQRFYSRDGMLFIEWKMRLPIGKKGLFIGVVDRFRLRDGLGIERAISFSRTRLMRSLIFHPRLWLGYIKYQLGCFA